MAWPDTVKRSHLDSALTFKLRRLAITMPIIETYSVYVNELMRMSDLYRFTMRHALKDYPNSLAARRGTDDSID